MKKLTEIINDNVENWPSENYIIEMATISKQERWGNEQYRIATHGPETNDRDNPHIHIYYSNDVKPYNQFNFEISLTDILCKNEINLIYQRDTKKHKLITHRNKCSWEGYRKLYEGFEDWLFDVNVKKRGEFIDNLDACIYFYNEEGPSFEQNPLLKYIKEHGLKILRTYKKYFSNNDIKLYKDCFE